MLLQAFAALEPVPQKIVIDQAQLSGGQS